MRGEGEKGRRGEVEERRRGGGEDGMEGGRIVGPLFLLVYIPSLLV